MSVWGTVWRIVRKDIALERRSFELLSTTTFFAVACLSIFAFAFVKEGQAVVDAAAGILWVVIAFAGTLALGRTFERERYGDTVRALLLAPVPRAAVYLGKLLGVLLLLLVLELLLVPMVALLFDAPLFRDPWRLGALLLLGTLGYAAVGTLFAAMLVRARTRDVMLPILLYPITIPVIIAGVRGTAALLEQPTDTAMAMLWIGLLGFFDVVFLTLALWTFEPLMQES